MKTFVLTLSKYFPKTHKRAGESTDFIKKLVCSLSCPGDCSICDIDQTKFKKIHTIRANYELWTKRIDQIQKGEARLSIRYWSGKPYNSPQVQIHELDKYSDIGIQKLEFSASGIIGMIRIDNEFPDVSIADIAVNDGLSYLDFKEWFKNYDLSKPMAIIHFTGMRY